MKWSVLGSQKRFERPWVSVREDTVRFENGLQQEIVVVENRIGVHTLAITDSEEIVLIDKPSYPAGLESQWELPGGVPKSGEALEVTAKRELLEEAGFAAGSLEKLFTLHKGPFRLMHPSHVFLATNLQEIADHEIDVHEPINRIVRISPEDAISEIGGLIVDTLTVASILWFVYKQLNPDWIHT